MPQQTIYTHTSNRGNTLECTVIFPEKNDLLTLQTLAEVLAHAGIFDGTTEISKENNDDN